MTTFLIQKIDTTQLDQLRELSIRTFTHAFAAQNDPADFARYVSDKFSRQQLLSELENPQSEFYFLMENDTILGYFKINEGHAQSEQVLDNALEIERIYVDSDKTGRGLGAVMMQFAGAKAQEKGYNNIWLGVWEENQAAIRFYEKNGFRVFGSHPFVLGTDVQTDLLMKKEISPDLTGGE